MFIRSKWFCTFWMTAMTLNPREDYIIIASLKSEPISKLINIKPGLCFWISIWPGSTLRTHVEWLLLISTSDSTCIVEGEPGKLEIKRWSPSILCISVLCMLVDSSVQIDTLPSSILTQEDSSRHDWNIVYLGCKESKQTKYSKVWMVHYHYLYTYIGSAVAQW